MTDATWKAFERRVAGLLGGTRAGPTGRNGPDVLHEAFAPQCKRIARTPAVVRKALAQAVRDAPPGKLPLVVMGRPGDPIGEALVVCRLADFCEWFGSGGKRDG